MPLGSAKRLLLLVWLGAAGCATAPSAGGEPRTAGLGPGFTHSNLRAQLYQAPLGDPAATGASLKSSLILFNILEQCASSETRADAGGAALEVRSCTRSSGGRRAEFSIPVEGRPRNLDVGYSAATQEFTFSLAPKSGAP